MSLPGGQNYSLYVIFQDKKKGVFYSRDRKNSNSKKKDPVVGLKRLLKLAQKYENTAEEISIYDHREGNPPDGKKIFQMNRGRIKLNLI